VETGHRNPTVSRFLLTCSVNPCELSLDRCELSRSSLHIKNGSGVQLRRLWEGRNPVLALPSPNSDGKPPQARDQTRLTRVLLHSEETSATRGGASRMGTNSSAHVACCSARGHAYLGDGSEWHIRRSSHVLCASKGDAQHSCTHLL